MTEVRSRIDSPVYPRLLRRVRASQIDAVIFIVVIVLWWICLPYLQGLHGSVRLGLLFILWFLLDPLLVAITGSTPGHHLMNISIVDVNTLQRLGLFRALCRSLLRTSFGWVSLVVILITKKHQALHDLVVRSTVILLNPDKVPESEKRTEQLPDENYRYPPIWRRTLIIFLYLFLWSLAIGIAMTLLLSYDCLAYARCAGTEHTLQLIFGFALLIVAAVILVCGCRGQLFGARRQALS